MKLSGAEAGRFLARPSPQAAGLLIFGADAMRVALKRQQAIAAITGPNAESETRLSRIAAADLRRDPALLMDAIKAQGFFPGPRVAFVEEAGDGLAEVITNALKAWAPGDAQIVVTAGSLTAKSALRKIFEAHPNAPAIGIYDDPPSQSEIEAELRASGLGTPSPEAMRDLITLSRDLDPGDFRQTLEKISLFKWGDPSPLTPAEIAACAPTTVEADVDDVIHAAAEGQLRQVGALLQRLSAQGVAPVTLAIRALQHYRALHAAASDPSGAANGLARARPPVFGPRRDRMLRQLRGLSVGQIESALSLIVETDMTLRSASKAPMGPLVERMMLRLASLPQGRG